MLPWYKKPMLFQHVVHLSLLHNVRQILGYREMSKSLYVAKVFPSHKINFFEEFKRILGHT